MNLISKEFVDWFACIPYRIHGTFVYFHTNLAKKNQQNVGKYSKHGWYGYEIQANSWMDIGKSPHLQVDSFLFSWCPIGKKHLKLHGFPMQRDKNFKSEKVFETTLHTYCILVSRTFLIPLVGSTYTWVIGGEKSKFQQPTTHNKSWTNKHVQWFSVKRTSFSIEHVQP